MYTVGLLVCRVQNWTQNFERNVDVKFRELKF